MQTDCVSGGGDEAGNPERLKAGAGRKEGSTGARVCMRVCVCVCVSTCWRRVRGSGGKSSRLRLRQGGQRRVFKIPAPQLGLFFVALLGTLPLLCLWRAPGLASVSESAPKETKGCPSLTFLFPRLVNLFPMAVLRGAFQAALSHYKADKPRHDGALIASLRHD